MKQLLLITLLSVTLFACKKDKNGDEPPASIDGFWTGSFSYTGSTREYDLAVVLRNNGTVRILYGYSGTDTADAAYISEDRFTYGADAGSVQFQSRESSYTYSYVGTAAGTTMTGTWGELPSSTDGGTWKLNRK